MLNNITLCKDNYLEFQIEDGFEYYQLPDTKNSGRIDVEEIKPFCTLWCNEMNDCLDITMERCTSTVVWNIYYVPALQKYAIHIQKDGVDDSLLIDEKSMKTVLKPLLNWYTASVIVNSVLDRILTYLPTIKKNCEEHDAH